MKKQTYYRYLAAIIVAMLLALGIGLPSGNIFVPTVIIACAVWAIWFCHSRVTDVMTDDLDSAISSKAALRALEVTVLLAAIGFSIAIGFYFAGSQGIGMHYYDNGSVRIHATQVYPSEHMIYEKNYLIADPTNLTMDDILALNQMFTGSQRVRDFPFTFGIALGSIVILLVGLYAAFSYYYTRKYEE
ncbi:MAG: hypothetical protein A4E35_01363 [Methanoregula sp. PtaU1.Bin051]|nr:MAG: hypothetical protein A4E35_01363 [Methanoregula sp. PtaU1.Bin051]